MCDIGLLLPNYLSFCSCLHYSMAGKTTSAGYRLPMATSSYHEKCIAASVKAIKDVSDKTSDKTYSHGAYRDCNVVAQERIWSEYVQRELKQAKTWYHPWQKGLNAL